MLVTPPLSSDLDDYQEIVAGNIRALMGRNRVSQETLAKVIGLTRPALSARLSGKTDISIREVAAIARFFGKPVPELFVTSSELGARARHPTARAVKSSRSSPYRCVGKKEGTQRVA